MLKQTGIFLGISILWLPLSMLSDGINTLILPAYLLRLAPQNQAVLLGLISFAGLALGMLVQIVAGSYSDRLRFRWNRRAVISLGIIILLPLLLLAEQFSSIWPFALIYLLIQIAANIIQAALQAFIPEQIQPKQRGLASGLKNLLDIGGALLVFMLLAKLFEAGQDYLVFRLLAFSFLLAYALMLIFVRELPYVTPQTTAVNLNFWQQRNFIWLILSRFLFLLGTYAVGRFLLFFVASRQDLAVSEAGKESATILTILTLITVIAAPIAGWLCDRFDRRWLMALAGFISAIAVLLLNFAHSTGQIMLFGSLLSIGSALFASANWALLADFAPTNAAARYFAIANLGTAGAAACAGIFGLLLDFGNQYADGLGYELLFAAVCALFLASLLASLQLATKQSQINSVPQVVD